jgi:hypothetical protein
LAKRGQRMLDRVENIQIIDSVVVNKYAILNTYQLSDEAGSIHDYNEFFQKNDNAESTVYMNQKEQNIYYGKKDEEGHYSLYTQSKLMDKWGDEKTLPKNVNKPVMIPIIRL